MDELKKLEQKRAKLDAKIEAAKQAEKRKISILHLLSDAKITHLSDEILRDAFARIARDNG